ncbi:aminotransferase class I/II-fold pyridoxal phosphate-dependent enzyme [Flavobacterium sp. W22_SRS_FP1]|uniref:aminotransferase class I/II-fold pyridoxal phosphate-dependent enzyme n=1 Tax=Flavobacterium sp. W22_SRS_FP1 TaxID=3240276 RepID=UPI003F8E5321
MKVDKFPNRIIEKDKEDYLYFGGTAYLGLPANAEFQNILIKNILIWGSSYGSSRNANIKLMAYENGESFLAKSIKSEASLTVSSGMLAGKIVIATLDFQTDCFFHFPNTHTAIKTPNSLPFFIGTELNPRLLDDLKEKITILTDAVPSFQVKSIDLSFLKLIPNNKEITLVVDESHSLGIVGENGCGIYSSIDYLNIKRKIMLASLGKAFGLTGGVIASDFEFIKQIAANEVFVSSAGMNPAFAQTIPDAKQIYIGQHQKLKDNLKYLKDHLTESKAFSFNKNYPIIYPENENSAETFAAHKIIITNFKYPTATKDLNRIVITANHRKEDLDKIIHILNHS